MFPNEILETYTNGFTSGETIEVTLYELVLIISMSNYGDVVKRLHSIIDQNDYLLSSFKRIVKSRFNYMSMKVCRMLSEEFQLNLLNELSSFQSIFYDDDKDAFIDHLASKYQEGYTANDLSDYIQFVVSYDSVNILKFMICNRIPLETLKNVAFKAVSYSNFEIIRLFEQYGVNYSTALEKNDFKHISHYDVTEWLLMNYHSDLIGNSSVKYSKSLIQGQESFRSVAIAFDLPNLYLKSLKNGQLTDDMPMLIDSEDYNILRSIPTFSCKELTYPIIMKSPEVFEIVLSKTNNLLLPTTFGLNILELAVRLSKLEFIKKIVEKEPMLLFVRDESRNNILHHCSLQHSWKVFKYIQTQLSDKFLPMMLEKNVYNESPTELLAKYEQGYFLNDLKDDLKYDFKDHEDMYVVKLPIVKNNRSLLDKIFETFLGVCKEKPYDEFFGTVSESETLKFLNMRNIKTFGKGFSHLKDCKCLKYLDVSKITSLNNTFNSIFPKSIKGLEYWNTSNVKKMKGTFNGVKILDYSPISNWDVSNVKSFKEMFAGSDIMELSALKNWKVNKDADFTEMFNYCDDLIDASALDSWQLSKKNPTVREMFNNCKNLKIYPKWWHEK